MIFTYTVSDQEGKKTQGTIEAPSADLAIGSLQKRGFIVVSIESQEKKSLFGTLTFFSGVSSKDVVMLSRQLSTLFEAKVSVVDALTLTSEETENNNLRAVLQAVAGDIQGGIAVSDALTKHPKVFSGFFINMVRSGEEAGKLSEVFSYLADYLERSYELKNKVRNALLYPAFVITAFFMVIVLMLTVVIPSLSGILLETGTELPIITKIVLGVSNFFVRYWVFLLVALIITAVATVRYGMTEAGKYTFSSLRISFPVVGRLYRKLYLARIADNMNTMLSSGISMVRAVEVTADVVGNVVYKNILKQAATQIKGGAQLSQALSQHPEIPRILTQMSRIGEETGELGFVLDTLAKFYKREVDSLVDTLVALIEPALIIVLAIGVGFLLVAVLSPIYSITANFA
ncbi:MAG: type II secretion system F family protein [bacterium]|nr:type II secretion system F family protein [bacterium]